jgi:soluble lytic murein transglycosylase-like protein
MSAIMYRESRCRPEVRNRSSSATGLLQILSSHCPWLARRMDTWCTRDRLNDPEWNVKAAAVLWREQGYGAWRATS